MEKKLTSKQERFCLEYVIDFNATRAAMSAGYSEHTAKDIGCENLSKPNIQDRLKELKAKTVDKLEITHEDIVRELMGFATLDTANIVSVESNSYVVDEGGKNEKRVSKQTVTVKDFEELTPIQRRAIKSVKNTKDGIVVEFFPKDKAFEMLAKHIGFYEKDNKQKVIIEKDYSNLTNEELVALSSLEKKASS